MGFQISNFNWHQGIFSPATEFLQTVWSSPCRNKERESRASLVVEQLDAWAESVPIWRWNSIAKGGRIVFGTF
jgi:hypothetical protein